MRTSTSKVVTCLDIGVIVGAAVSSVVCSLRGLARTKEMNRRLYDVSAGGGVLRFNIIPIVSCTRKILCECETFIQLPHFWSGLFYIHIRPNNISRLVSIINSLIFYGLIPQSRFVPFCLNTSYPNSYPNIFRIILNSKSQCVLCRVELENSINKFQFY